MADILLNCMGMVCPVPIAKVQQKIGEMKRGQTLEVVADCSTFSKDVTDWCSKTSHPLISLNTVGKDTKAVIRI